jgi:dTDP-glucose 4,6-dehydratase
MIIYVDIDETICTTPQSRDYSLATPIIENIERINKLHDEGHKIIYWTARGTSTGIDWRKITESQFRRWKVKYDKLELGKPMYDLFICDKATNSEIFFKEQLEGK